MPKIASLLTLICVLTQWGATASAQTCEYAGQTFSLGSTVCECPNLRILRSANSAGRGEITGPKLGQHQFSLFGCLHLGRSCRGRIQKI